jgi:hypothetical protein
MEKFKILEVYELEVSDLYDINGGGPIRETISWYYQTMGSFFHGLYDGLVGNDSAV